MSDTVVIKSFGVFWEREHIEWGHKGPGGAGTLLGYATTPSKSIDFREQRGIYVLYEGVDIASHRVIYVGQAGSGHQDLFHRLRNHRDDHLWNRWQRFSWFGFLGVGTQGLVHKRKASTGALTMAVALDQMEAILIALLEPLRNSQGPKWRGATEYFQVHKRTDPPSAG